MGYRSPPSVSRSSRRSLPTTCQARRSPGPEHGRYQYTRVWMWVIGQTGIGNCMEIHTIYNPCLSDHQRPYPVSTLVRLPNAGAGRPLTGNGIKTSLLYPTRRAHPSVDGALSWGSRAYSGDIKNRKLPVLNQGQRDLAITMSGKRDRPMGHLKTILVAPCDEQSTSPLRVILRQNWISDSLRRKHHFLLSAHHRFIFAFSSYWFTKS